jgi:hypothetical protein
VKLFGDKVVLVDGTGSLDLTDTKSKCKKCLYDVLFHHTYKHRFEQILRDAKIPFKEDLNKVACRYHVSSMEESKSAVTHFYSIDCQGKSCILIVKRDCKLPELQDIVCRYNAGAVTVYSEHYNETYAKTPIYADSGYIVNATMEMEYDFIKKALAHSSYLSKDTAIIEGEDKYKFRELQQKNNMLIPVDCFLRETLTTYVI